MHGGAKRVGGQHQRAPVGRELRRMYRHIEPRGELLRLHHRVRRLERLEAVAGADELPSGELRLREYVAQKLWVNRPVEFDSNFARGPPGYTNTGCGCSLSV